MNNASCNTTITNTIFYPLFDIITDKVSREVKNIMYHDSYRPTQAACRIVTPPFFYNIVHSMEIIQHNLLSSREVVDYKTVVKSISSSVRTTVVFEVESYIITRIPLNMIPADLFI